MPGSGPSRWAIRTATGIILAGSVLLSGAALGIALWPGPHGILPPLVQEQPPPAPPRDLAEYRLEQAERQIQSLEGEHRALTILLVVNLVAVVTSLVTYIITRKR